MKNVCSYSAIEGKNAKGLDALIALAIRNSKTARQSVQIASVGIVYHGAKHGNCLNAKVNTLLEGLGNGINRASLQQFFINCGYVFESNEETKQLECTSWTKEKARDLDTLNYAKTTPWYEVVKATEAKVWNMNDAFESFVKTCQSKIKTHDKIMNDTTLSEEDKAKKLALLEIDVDLMRTLNLVRSGETIQPNVDETEVTVDAILDQVA